MFSIYKNRTDFYEDYNLALKNIDNDSAKVYFEKALVNVNRCKKKDKFLFYLDMTKLIKNKDYVEEIDKNININKINKVSTTNLYEVCCRFEEFNMQNLAIKYYDILLKRTLEESLKMKALSSIAMIYSNKDNRDKTLEYLDLINFDSKYIKDSKDFKELYNIGKSYYNVGDFAKGEKFLMLSNKISKSVEEKFNVSLLLGRIEVEKRKYTTALSRYNSMLDDLDKENVDTKLINDFYYETFNTYCDIEDFENAKKISDRYYEIYSPKFNGLMLGKCTNLYGEGHEVVGEFSEALELYNKALEFAGDDDFVLYIYKNIQDTYGKQHMVEEALVANEKYNEVGKEKYKDSVKMHAIYENNAFLFGLIEDKEESCRQWEKAVDIIKKEYGRCFKLASNYNVQGIKYADLIDDFKSEYIKKAEESYKKSIEILLELSPNPLLGTVYRNLALFYEDMNNYKEAIFTLKKCLEDVDKSFKIMHYYLSYDLGRIYFKIGENKKSLSLFTYGKVLIDEENKETLKHYIVESKVIMAKAYYGIGNIEKSLSLFLELVEDKEKDFSIWIDLGDIYEYISAIYSDMNNYEECIKYAEKAIKNLKNRNEDITKIYIRMYRFAYLNKRYEDCIYYMECAEANELDLDKDNKRALSSIYMDLGSVYMNIELEEGNIYFDKAIKYAKESLDWAKKSDEPLEEYYNTLGKAYKLRNYVDLSVENYKYALDYILDRYGEINELAIRQYEYMAFLYNEKLKYNRAEEYYIKMLNLTEKVYGPKSNNYKEALLKVEGFYYLNNNMEKAEDYLNKSMSIETKNNRDKIHDYETAVALYERKKDYNMALKYAFKAKDILEKNNMMESIEGANNLNVIGIMYNLLEEYDKSQKYYEQALDITKAVYGEDHVNVLITTNNLASIYEKSKNYLDALKMYKKSLVLGGILNYNANELYMIEEDIKRVEEMMVVK